jgi:trimethylamine--corrinoid protein Co-methyltransferase
LDKLQHFSPKELGKIHDSSMEILGETGVAFQAPQALEVFENHGFKVDGQTVFFDEIQVTKALEKVPKQFIITARNPEKSVIVGSGDPVCAPGYGAPFIAEPGGDQRPGTMEDYINFCKLVHTSQQIDMIGYEMVDPSDVPSEQAHLHMMRANLTFSDKPFMGTVVPPEAAQDAIEMASFLWGGMEFIEDKYVILPTINPISPLVWDTNMAGAILVYAQNNQPIMFENLMMSGSTGPVTLAGTIVLQNAEILSGIVLAQLLTPGLPVIFGNIPGITDMRTGNLSIGAPESSIFVSANAQMAEFYGVPGRSGGNLTDAHIPDMQAGIESAICMLMAMRSGTTFLLHSCGILGSYMAMSYEKFIIDEEIIAMIKHLLRPVVISDATIDLETIKEVGIGGEYLSHPKTYENFREQHFDSSLLNRFGYNEWKEHGGNDLQARAREMYKERLSSYKKPEIDPEIEARIDSFIHSRIKG